MKNTIIAAIFTLLSIGTAFAATKTITIGGQQYNVTCEAVPIDVTLSVLPVVIPPPPAVNTKKPVPTPAPDVTPQPAPNPIKKVPSGPTTPIISTDLTATSPWVLDRLENNSTVNIIVSVPGASVGDSITNMVFTPRLPAGVVFSADIRSNGTVAIAVTNQSGLTITNINGNFTIRIAKK